MAVEAPSVEADCSDHSDGLEFEDCSGGEEDIASTPVASPLLRLPRGVPTKDEVVRQALETRASFQTNGASKMPLSKEILGPTWTIGVLRPLTNIEALKTRAYVHVWQKMKTSICICPVWFV